MFGLTLLDFIAFSWYVLCWAGYTLYADHSRFHKQGVSAAMAAHRRAWMQEMLRRELRMVDTQIQGILMNGVAFFASTTMLAVGGLIALLGAGEQALRVLAHFPLVSTHSLTVWETKIVMLVIISITAFFKFAWSYRLFNYCNVLIGALPWSQRADAAARDMANDIAAIHSLAASHFNRGLRTYFYALAGLAWILHPLLFMIATLWVTYVLFRREFRSQSLAILQRNLDNSARNS